MRDGFVGSKVDWTKVGEPERSEALETEELSQQAPKPEAMATEAYGLWLAVAAFLIGRIKEPYEYVPRKPGSPLGDESDHGFVVRTKRSTRGYPPGTLCAVQLYFGDLGEKPPQFYEAKCHVVVRTPWLAHTTGPKRKTVTLTQLPFVRDRLQLEQAFREALAVTLGLEQANDVLGIKTAHRRRQPKGRANRGWTELDRLRSLADSLQARLRNLALLGPDVLGPHQGQVLAHAYRPSLPGDTSELGQWLAEAQQLFDLAQAQAKLVEVRRQADEQRRQEEAAREEAERLREHAEREEERRRLMTLALKLLTDAGESKIPRTEWPEVVPALWQAIPGQDSVGKTTPGQVQTLQEALSAAQEAWTQFLLAKLLAKYGGTTRRPKPKKRK